MATSGRPVGGVWSPRLRPALAGRRRPSALPAWHAGRPSELEASADQRQGSGLHPERVPAASVVPPQGSGLHPEWVLAASVVPRQGSACSPGRVQGGQAPACADRLGTGSLTSLSKQHQVIPH